MKLQVQGREAYVYTGGKPFDAALPCVVFVHGALHDHSVWGLQSRWFAHHGHAVMAVDLPGHGRSAGPALQSVEAMADWLVTLLDVAGVRQVALVGHSMGSLIGLEAAARLGERATRLVMVGTAYPMKVTPALLDMGRDTPLAAIDRVNVFSHSTLSAKPSAPGPGSWLQGANRALMRRLQAGYALAHAGANLFSIDFNACNQYAGGLAAAARLQCCVGMLLGEKDSMAIPKSASEIADTTQARVLYLNAGHSLMSEVPDGVLNGLRDLLS
jgi:pimeloyl-ACP methyl ester carboxylesterase